MVGSKGRVKQIMILDGFTDITSILGCGVYVLLYRGEIVYVGRSKLLYQRIYTHRYNSRSSKVPSWIPYKKMKFDAVQVMPCHVDKIAALEETLIQKHQPRYNERLLGPQPRTKVPLELLISKAKGNLDKLQESNKIVRRILKCSDKVQLLSA